MKYNDDTFYIELFLNIVIKVKSESKKNKIKKLQKLMESILRDEELDIVKSESNMIVMSETELLNTLQTNYDDGDLN